MGRDLVGQVLASVRLPGLRVEAGGLVLLGRGMEQRLSLARTAAGLRQHRRPGRASGNQLEARLLPVRWHGLAEGGIRRKLERRSRLAAGELLSGLSHRCRPLISRQRRRCPRRVDRS